MMSEFVPKIILPESDEELLSLCTIETFRSSGSGGQHVNTTDSAVRLTYLPQKIVVTCQQERSQYLNKMLCIKKLREKVDRLNYRPPPRIKTKLPYHQKMENLNQKKKHGEKKQQRRKINPND